PVSGWNTAALPEGASAFTAVAVSADKAAGRGRVRRVVSVRNDERSPTVLFTTPSLEVAWGETLPIRVVTVGQNGPVRLSVRRGADELVTEAVEADGVRTFDLDTRAFGVGQITLRAFLVSSEDVADEGEDSTRPAGVRSAPLSVEITPPAERAPSVSEDAALLWGPALRWADGRIDRFGNGLNSKSLRELKGPARTPFALSAVVEIEDAGLYRLAIRSNCGVTVEANGEPAPYVSEPSAASVAGKAWRSVPLWLAAGRHRLRLSGRSPAKNPIFDLRWGRRGSQTIDSATWRRTADEFE
ncbi:MAG: hypothetical protein AAF907_08785, partial [Planctomycetota bacterium]